MKKLIVLSGPSGVGKTSLLKALRRVHPEIAFGTLTLYISRKPRPGEKDGVDFHFRSEQEIRSFPEERYLVAKGRVVWQAIDLEETRKVLETSSLVIVEIHPTLAKLLVSHPRMRGPLKGFEIRTVFLSPLYPGELDQLSRSFPSRQEALAAVMLHKLVYRSLQQGKILTLEEFEDLRARALKAFEEVEMASRYTDIIVNHDGEDSPNWRFTPPLGEAGQTLRRFTEIINA